MVRARRPLSDKQLVRTVIEQMKGNDRPDFCPVCGEHSFEHMTQDHPFGDTFVTESLGYNCANCGRMYTCPDCEGWHTERWGLNGSPPPDDVKPYLCDCPVASASRFEPGTLTS